MKAGMALVAVLVGYQPAVADLEIWIADVMQRPGGAIEPLPERPDRPGAALPMPPPADPFDITRAEPIVLEYLGRIFINDQVWALIRTPEGGLQSLRTGDTAPYSEGLELTSVHPGHIELSLAGKIHRIERSNETGRSLR
ncbi:MAG: hypothetical protein KGY57_04225 [Gammaproteobacteria bacterium]|nr:hypothetical protein [Gammaproteobacteria bacterium]